MSVTQSISHPLWILGPQTLLITCLLLNGDGDFFSTYSPPLPVHLFSICLRKPIESLQNILTTSWLPANSESLIVLPTLSPLRHSLRNHKCATADWLHSAFIKCARLFSHGFGAGFMSSRVPELNRQAFISVQVLLCHGCSWVLSLFLPLITCLVSLESLISLPATQSLLSTKLLPWQKVKDCLKKQPSFMTLPR